MKFLTHPRLLSRAACLALASSTIACRATGKLTGNEYANPQAKLEWVARPELDLPHSDQPTVYVRPFKDAVGAGLDLTPQVKAAIVAAGYTISDSRSADYQLVATLRHFDKAKSFDGGEGAMRTVQGLAPLAGAIGGAYAGSEHGTAGVVAGGILGGTAGTIAGAMMENFSKVAEWDLVLDLELMEFVEGGFEETRARSEAANSGSAVTVGNEHGDRITKDTRSAELNQEKEYFRNTFRLVGVAYQMRMTREEALAELLPRLPGAIQSVLP